MYAMIMVCHLPSTKTRFIFRINLPHIRIRHGYVMVCYMSIGRFFMGLPPSFPPGRRLPGAVACRRRGAGPSHAFPVGRLGAQRALEDRGAVNPWEVGENRIKTEVFSWFEKGLKGTSSIILGLL